MTRTKRVYFNNPLIRAKFASGLFEGEKVMLKKRIVIIFCGSMLFFGARGAFADSIVDEETGVYLECRSVTGRAGESHAWFTVRDSGHSLYSFSFVGRRRPYVVPSSINGSLHERTPQISSTKASIATYEGVVSDFILGDDGLAAFGNASVSFILSRLNGDAALTIHPNAMMQMKCFLGE